MEELMEQNRTLQKLFKEIKVDVGRFRPRSKVTKIMVVHLKTWKGGESQNRGHGVNQLTAAMAAGQGCGVDLYKVKGAGVTLPATALLGVNSNSRQNWHRCSWADIMDPINTKEAINNSAN